MKRIKDIALYTSLCFSLLMLFICAMFVIAESNLTTETSAFSAVDFADKAFLLLVYSVCVGFSFLVFDLNKISTTARRLIHVVLNYGLMVAFIVFFTKANAGATVVSGDRTMLIFAASFLYIIIYAAAMLVSKGVNKLGTLVDSRKK